MNKKFKLCKFVVVIFIVVFMNNSVYGSPADYTDEDADRDVQKLIQEHNNEFDSKKSENNYLSKLSVKGGTLSPDFERQTLNYSLKLKNNINEIEIVAETDNKNAKINGSGKIDISNVTECKVEVIADSGTVRTYIIKIIKDGEDNQNISTEEGNISEDNEEKFIEKTVEKMQHIESNNKKTVDKYRLRIIPIIVLALCILIIIVFNRISKKSKHKN